MLQRALFVLVLLLLIPSLSFAAIDAQKISELRAEVVQDITAHTSGSSIELTVDVLIPQEDGFQKRESLEVSIPYTLKEDDMGNEMVTVVIENPADVVDFQIRSIVTVNRRTSITLPKSSGLLRSTDLIESKNPDIISLAEQITAGKSIGFEQVSAVAGWINKNINYDLKYADVNLSASQVLNLKAGVCDEMSTLELSMLRSLGYPSAYVVGYAYGRGYRTVDDFVPHGWTEVCSPNGECFSADPTWAEVGWLDSMHIKFATLQNSGNYIEATALAKGYGGDLKVGIDGVNTKIKILDTKEEHVVEAKSELLEDTVSKGYAIVKTDLSSDGCIMTKITRSSCTLDGKSLLKTEMDSGTVSLCGKKSVFSLFKLPDTLDKNTRYSCSLGIAVGGNGVSENTVVLESTKDGATVPRLSLDKTSLKPNEEFIAVSLGAHIFTDFGKYGKDSLVSKAPSESFKIFAYKGGQLAEQDVDVSQYRPLEIKVFVNSTLVVGKIYGVNVSVQNVADSEKEVSVTLGNITSKSTVSVSKSKIFKFNFTAETLDDSIVRVFVSTRDFSTSVSKSVEVIQPSMGNFIQEIIQAVIDFLKKLFGG